MNYHYPLTKLPKKIDYCLFLIREELKSRRFFNGLHAASIDDVSLQPHLDILILKHAGLDDGADTTFELYSKIMERRCKKIDKRTGALEAQTVKVYIDLVVEKRRRSG